MYLQCTKKMLDKLDRSKIRLVSAEVCDDGAGGFEEYMRIISNPDCEEYEFMTQWAKSTKARKRSVEEINLMLRYYH